MFITTARLITICLALATIVPRVCAAENKLTQEETTILTLILKEAYSDGGYTVVNAQTGFSHSQSDNAAEIEKSKNDISQRLQTNGIVVSTLVDQLFRRNQTPVQLLIKSSPKDGYLIDFEGKYDKYFKKNGGGWEKWYKENPNAHGNTTVSLPVYDKKTGLVVVYKGTQSHGLDGAGWIILYRYEQGILKELNRVMLWIS
jgi:hypothetical protein